MSIYSNGEFAGYVTSESAGFGHTLGKTVCMGYICGAEGSGVAMEEIPKQVNSSHLTLSQGRTI